MAWTVSSVQISFASLALLLAAPVPAAVIDPALGAEEKIAFAQHRDFEGLGDQFREVSKRNKEQIEPR